MYFAATPRVLPGDSVPSLHLAGIIGRLRTPIRQAFSYGIRHIPLWFTGLWVRVHWFTIKTCRVPYENTCRTGVRNFSIMLLRNYLPYAHQLSDENGTEKMEFGKVTHPRQARRRLAKMSNDPHVAEDITLLDSKCTSITLRLQTDCGCYVWCSV